MITESKYPILEFDDNKVAKLNPTSFADQSFETDKLIITFFPEVMVLYRVFMGAILKFV